MAQHCILLLLTLPVLFIFLASAASPRSITPPSGLTAGAINSSAIRLSWHAAASSPGTSIIRYTIARNGSRLVELPGTQLSYIDSNLIPSTTYVYQLRAFNTRNQASTLSTRVVSKTSPRPSVPVSPSGPTELLIRTPDVVVGFDPDATGVPFNWGFMQPGAFLQYQLRVKQAGSFTLTLLESSWEPSAGAKVILNGNWAASIIFTSKDSWSDYVASEPVLLTFRAGTNTLRVQDTVGVGFNLAGLTLAPSAITSRGRKGINAGDIMYLDSAEEADAEAAVLVDLGVSWARADFAWSGMEYDGPGVYSTSGHDNGVRALTAKGINVLGIIDYTPPWANGGNDQMVPPSASYIAAFGTFAGYLAARYGPLGVHTWEIWNEPNLINFWSTGADPDLYTKLLKSAYSAIKAADPSAFVLTGGMAPACTCDGSMRPQEFLTGVYEAGGKDYFDAVAMHPYTYPALPTATDGAYWWMAMKELREIMAGNGDAAKPMWSTEYGAPTNGPVDSGRVSETDQATMLTAAYTLNRATPWAGPLFWYCLNDPDTDDPSTVENFFGVVRFDKSLKLAYAALRAVPDT